MTMNNSHCCGGEPASCEPAKPGRCARCGGELARWVMARGTILFCSWFCWHLADDGDNSQLLKPID